MEIEDPEDDDHWASYLCNVYYECGFEAENGSDYVHRFVYSYDKTDGGQANTTRPGGVGSFDRMPYRKGYEFIGWSVEMNISAEEFEEKRKKYVHCTPFTKESLLYREIFEKYYPGQSQMIADFWMPNKSWRGCNVDDPSARVLSNYGESGK